MNDKCDLQKGMYLYLYQILLQPIEQTLEPPIVIPI